MSRPSNVAMLVGKYTAVVGASLAAVYCAALGWLVYTSPLSFRELDLNHDGHVSFGEVSYASSFGERGVEINGQQCTEYFAYKDGLPLKIVCGGQV